jgi:hypothetical protein
MYRLLQASFVVVTLLLSPAWGGVAAQDEQAAGVPADTTATVDNSYFPQSPGTSRVYEGQEVDPATGETVTVTVREHVSPVPTEVAGVPVTEIRVTELENGQLIEATSDYHAQDSAGNVYYLGEHVNKYENGQLVSHEGQWFAGEDGNQAGVMMPAEPIVGQRVRQEQAPGVAQDISTVVATDLTVTTAAGTFSGCIKTQDLNPLDQSIEYKYYCPDVGLVREENANGTVDLVSVTGG